MAGCATQRRSFEYQEQEARLSDLPVLLGAKRVSSMERAGDVRLVYETAESIDEVSAFYCSEMELLGWRKRHSFTFDDRFFVFEKPSRTSIIMLARHASTVRIILCISGLRGR